MHLNSKSRDYKETTVSNDTHAWKAAMIRGRCVLTTAIGALHPCDVIDSLCVIFKSFLKGHCVHVDTAQSVLTHSFP